MARKSQRRFEFGWLELISLVLVFSVGAAAVFLLGIFVGQGLQEQRIRGEDRTVRLTIDGLATGPTEVADDVQLVDKLDRPAPLPTIELRVKPQASPLATALATATPVTPPTASPGALPTPSVAPSPRPTPMPTVSPSRGVLGDDRGRWSVQVNATRDPLVARRMVESLRAQGYRAYEVRVRLQGETWLRVRVGRFVTMEEATAIVVRLKGNGGFTRAFLVEE